MLLILVTNLAGDGMSVCAYLLHKHTVSAIAVSYHSTDHLADVDRVYSSNVVTVFVTVVLWADLQELQTCL